MKLHEIGGDKRKKEANISDLIHTSQDWNTIRLEMTYQQDYAKWDLTWYKSWGWNCKRLEVIYQEEYVNVWDLTWYMSWGWNCIRLEMLYQEYVRSDMVYELRIKLHEIGGGIWRKRCNCEIRDYIWRWGCNYVILCCINRFTALSKNLFNLLE